MCEQSVRALVHSLGGHYSALMPLLSSGEGRYVNASQWRDMVTYTRKYSRVALFPGVVRESTRAVIALGRHAKELGVDGIAVTTPFGRDVSQKAIFEHFREIYDAVGLPIFLYNEELISGNAIEIPTFEAIFAAVPIVGVKESSGDMETFRALLSIAGKVPVFQGWENLALASSNGAGYIFPLANLNCELCQRAFVTRGADLQAEINAQCAKYGLFEDDWYKRIKRELQQRGIISHSATIEEARQAYA